MAMWITKYVLKINICKVIINFLCSNSIQKRNYRLIRRLPLQKAELVCQNTPTDLMRDFEK